MKVVYGIGSLDAEKKRRVLTIGVFDGVHRGHVRILKSVVAEARRRRIRSGVVTFADHPAHTFLPQQKVPALTSLGQKLKFLEREGVDTVYVLSFTKALARMDACAFVKKILIDRMGMAALHVGEDFVFGKDARGNIDLLRKFSRLRGFALRVLRHLKSCQRVISSTSIRELIKKGDLKHAQLFLGRRVSISGHVVRGRGRGRMLGFPTANIAPHHEVLVPDGIYACFVHRVVNETSIVRMADDRGAGKPYRGLAYLGVKPTFNDRSTRRSIEVFLFGCDQNLYAKTLEIFFVKKLRDDKKFSSPHQLIAQMKRDRAAAAKIFLKTKF
jgi:riboflavin kinase/FMN adenylyltransferase